jgi:hypothetical protein
MAQPMTPMRFYRWCLIGVYIGMTIGFFYRYYEDARLAKILTIPSWSETK